MEKLLSPTSKPAPELTTAEIAERARQLVANGGGESPGKPDTESRLSNILEAAGRVMDLSELEAILAEDGGRRLGRSAIGGALNQREIFKSLGKHRWIHADFYVEGMEIFYESVENQAVCAALQAGGQISFEEIRRALEGWRGGRTVKTGTLTAMIGQAVAKGNLRRLQNKLYIHPDNCAESAPMSLEDTKYHAEELLKENAVGIRLNNILRLLRADHPGISEKRLKEALAELMGEEAIRQPLRGRYIHAAHYEPADWSRRNEKTDAELRQLTRQRHLARLRQIYASSDREERLIIDLWRRTRLDGQRQLSPANIEALNDQIFQGAGWGLTKIKRFIRALETELEYPG